MNLFVAITFGAMTHFAQFDPLDIMPHLSGAGINGIRDEIYWNHVETQPGVFTYSAKFVNYMAKAKELGLDTMIVLDWSNRHYDYEAGDFTFPHTPAGRAGFVNYALNVLTQFPQIKSVEIWNEVNAGTFIRGPATADRAGYYAELLKVLYPAIKAIRPDVTVCVGATVPIAHGFFRDLFTKGAMPFFDAVSVHPYRGYADGVDIEIWELGRLIRGSNNGSSKPVWVTEFSYSAKSEADRAISATYLPQIATLFMTQGVSKMYYYLALDQGSFAYRGLIGKAPTYIHHPVLDAYSTLIGKMSGVTKYKSRHATPSFVYAHTFWKGITEITVVWSRYPCTLSYMGASGLTSIQIGPTVQYIEGPMAGVTISDTNVLADSVSGYSNNNGRAGWYYGVATVPQTYNASLLRGLSWLIWKSDNYRWKGPGDYPFITSEGVHPSGDWAIRRWFSNYAGAARIDGTISRGAGGDGVDLIIFVDSVEVHRQEVLPGQSFAFSADVTLKVNSKVDFAVTARGNQSNDFTVFAAKIEKL